MLWVTWRQHRGLLISVLATFTAALILIPVAGFKIHHDYATLLACRPATSPGCLQLRSGFNTDWHLGNGIRVALVAAPVLLAMFAGPPVLARELENRTYRYAWTQGIGRVRWTAAKLAILGSAVTIAALAVSQLFTWLFTPFLTTQNVTVLSPAVFETRGTAYAAWTLTGFCLGAFLGMLLRHVLAAMAATLGGYLALAAADPGVPAQPLPGPHVLAHAGLRERLARRRVGATRRGHHLAAPPPRRLGRGLPGAVPPRWPRSRTRRGRRAAGSCPGRRGRAGRGGRAGQERRGRWPRRR